MKKLKAVIGLLLALCMVFGSFAPVHAFAQAETGVVLATEAEKGNAGIDVSETDNDAENKGSGKDTEGDVTDTDGIEGGSENDEPDKPEGGSEDSSEPAGNVNEKVARVSFNCYYKFPVDMGHVWINFENISEKELTIGAYALAPGESVSVGFFNFKRNEGSGVYYNVENYFINKGDAQGRVSMFDLFTEAQVSKASDIICRKNREPYSNNCVTFALDLWNISSRKLVLPIPVPAVIYFVVMFIGGFDFNESVPAPERENICRHYSSSDGDYIETVSNGSLIEGI